MHVLYIIPIRFILDGGISFYSLNTNKLSRKPKIAYLYLTLSIQEFDRK